MTTYQIIDGGSVVQSVDVLSLTDQEVADGVELVLVEGLPANVAAAYHRRRLHYNPEDRNRVTVAATETTNVTPPNLDPNPDARYFAVLVEVSKEGHWQEPYGLSRRRNDGTARPFGGEWGLLSKWEAERLRDAFNADAVTAGPDADLVCTARVVEFCRWDQDPEWPEEWA